MARPLTAIACVLTAWVTLLAPRPLFADWRSINQVALGTAQTMEQSTFSIGIVAPLLAGLTNRLTIQTHPILDLLLVPNLALRYRIVDQTRFVVSATSSFKRSFGQGPTTEQQEKAPGELVVGGIVSVWLGQQWSLTGGAYYANHFDELINNKIKGFSQGIAASLGVHFLPRTTDLLQFSTYVRYGFAASGFDDPVLAATWTHSLGRWLGGAHTVIHLTVNDRLKGAPRGLSVLENWPVVPTVDLWWRL